MRVDRPPARRLAAPTALAVLLAAGPAGAQAPYGTVQVQYQRSDDAALFQRGNGEIELRRSRQEYFLRAFDLRQQTYLRDDLMLETSVRMSERSVVGDRDLTRTPTGAIRLTHPFLQFSASHQPAWERTTRRISQSPAADSVEQVVTTRSRESVVAAHVAVPNLPRVDLTYVNRRRTAQEDRGNRNQTGSVRVSFDRERYSSYAMVNQSRYRSDLPGSSTNRQTVLAGGGSYVLAPRKDVSLRGQYDVTDLKVTSGAAGRPDIVSHAALLDGSWRTRADWDQGLNLQWRRAGTGTATVPAQTNVEGALTSRYQFTRRSNVIAATGFRTATFLANGNPERGYQKYGTAVATIDAPVRRRLGLAASAAHTTNWDPGRTPYSVESVIASTRGNVTRRIVADFNWQLAFTGDSAASGSRYSTAWTSRVQGNPLRTLQGHVAFRSQRAGPGLSRPASVTRGFSAEGTWKPTPRMDVLAQYSSTRVLPSTVSGLSTRSVTVRYEPVRKWQTYTVWTRSEQRVTVSTAGQLSSREVLTTRVQYAPNRRLAASASLSYNDPGRDEESRRLDVTLVWSFGR